MKARDKDGSKNKTNKNGSKESTILSCSSCRFKKSKRWQNRRKIGTYNPLTTPAEINIDKEAAKEWLKKGAIPTDTVKNLFSKAGIMKEFHEEKQGK